MRALIIHSKLVITGLGHMCPNPPSSAEEGVGGGWDTCVPTPKNHDFLSIFCMNYETGKKAKVLKQKNALLHPSNTLLHPSSTLLHPCNTLLHPCNALLQPSNTILLRPAGNRYNPPTPCRRFMYRPSCCT